MFLATGECQTEPAFGQAMAALLENLGAFGTAATMAQVLPVLHGHSYLDIASRHCGEEPGRSWASGIGVSAGVTTGVAGCHQCRGGFSQTR